MGGEGVNTCAYISIGLVISFEACALERTDSVVTNSLCATHVVRTLINIWENGENGDKLSIMVEIVVETVKRGGKGKKTVVNSENHGKLENTAKRKENSCKQ